MNLNFLFNPVAYLLNGVTYLDDPTRDFLGRPYQNFDGPQ